ncbi:OmpA family protein [Dysgonomonas termitidis]
MIKLTGNKLILFVKTKLFGMTGGRALRKTRIYVPVMFAATLFIFLSCRSGGAPVVRPLFMQSKRANVGLPGDAAGLQATLQERVSYRHADNTSLALRREDSLRKQATSLKQMQYLNEVVVTARLKQKFAPEREGRVRVDFIVDVPGELLDDNWRVTLFPRILHNDSVVPLEKLVLNGKVFAQKQAQDYKEYDAYKNSIIHPSAYDSIFPDRKKISLQIRRLQEYYWDMYYSQWKEADKYEKLRRQLEARYNRDNALRKGRRNALYHDYMLRGEEEVLRSLAAGSDTTGIMARYIRKFEKRANLLPIYKPRGEFNEKNLPRKYRDFYLNGTRLENIPNHVTTEADSVRIARHSYFYEAIAENESKLRRLGDTEDGMIPFPRQGGARLDSLVAAGAGLRYHYSQDYPVTPGLGRLRVVMDGRVEATDRSAYSLAASDTLTYMISSLAQLADTSLMVTATKLYRNMYNMLSIYPEFAAAKGSFDIRYADNRRQADTLISTYNKLTGEMGLQLDSLEIQSSVSLEGDYDKNHELSAQRAEALKDYLVSAYPSFFRGDLIRTSPVGEDWKGLVKELRQRDGIAHKDSILGLLGRAVYPDETEREIKTRFRQDYKVIHDSVYPKLRRMDITFHMSRPHMVSADSMQYEVREGYGQGLRLLQQREYWQALEILKDYPDYNTALCLACLGYNGRAYDILVQLPVTAGSEYLLAIVSYRMGKGDDAAGHLVRAVELDPRKAYRIGLDSETAELVRAYGLDAQIRRLGAADADVLPEGPAPESGTGRAGSI